MRRRSSVATNLLTLKQANSDLATTPATNHSSSDSSSPMDSSASAEDAPTTTSPKSSPDAAQPSSMHRHSLDSLHHFHHGSFTLPLNKISENGDDDDDDDDGPDDDQARFGNTTSSCGRMDCVCGRNDDDLCTCEHRMFDCNHQPGQQPQFDSTSTCDSIENIPIAVQNRFQRGMGIGGDSPLSTPRRRKMNVESMAGVAANGYRNVGGYLIAVHRKLSRQDTYFLSYHKTRPSLFGVPLLIPCYEGGSNKDVYCAVWMQVARLLSPLPSTPPDQLNHATDW